MTYISNLGKNSIEEYKEFGEKVVAESAQILKNANIPTPVFNQESKSNPMEGLEVEHSVSTNGTVENAKENDNKSSFEPTAITQNETLNNVKVSNGISNTMYKKGLKAGMVDSNKISGNVGEALNSLEEADGNDGNDDMAEFMESNFKQGSHLNGGGDAYYESGEKSSTQSVNANISGSYKNKNNDFTVLYGGTFEYSSTDQKDKEVDNYGGESGNNKNGSALVMAKYNKGKMTFAGGGSAYFYDNNTQLFNIYAGAAISDVAVTLRREIKVAWDAEGQKTVNNQTNVKVNILKPKEAGDFTNTVPDIPTPSETQQYASLVESDKREVDDIINQKGQYGLRMDLELFTSSDADEYGVVVKHTSLLSKKKDKNKTITLTPYVGVYDRHPNSQEGLKLRAGAEAKLDVTTDNKINFKAKGIIDNKRIIQNGSYPQDTFMAVIDSSVSKKNISATVSAGHINSSPDVKYSFITGGVTYKMKHSTLSAVMGLQKFNIAEDGDKIFHAGVRYAVSF